MIISKWQNSPKYSNWEIYFCWCYSLALSPKKVTSWRHVRREEVLAGGAYWSVLRSLPHLYPTLGSLKTKSKAPSAVSAPSRVSGAETTAEMKSTVHSGCHLKDLFQRHKRPVYPQHILLDNILGLFLSPSYWIGLTVKKKKKSITVETR